MDSITLKKLIKVVLLTVVISYAVDKLVFFGLNAISDKAMTGQAIGKLNHFLSIKDSTDILVFGNSRANHHIDIDFLGENGYNMGVDATGIAYSSTLINTLSKDKKQHIIVHLDTKNFFDSTYAGEDIRGLKTKFNRDESITEALNNSGQISVMQHFYNCMNYNGKSIGILKNFFKPNYDYKSYNGYDPLVISESKAAARDAVLAREDAINCLDNYEINEVALDYLKSIKAYAEKSEKSFVFITSPTHKDPCSGDNEKLKATMKALGLIYKDYSNLYDDLDDNSYWNDKTHLSKKGAEAFSKYIIGDLRYTNFN